MNAFLEAMHFAHACKVFDPAREIAKRDFDEILEAGRLSPSSFGLEHTKLLVVQSQEVKEALKPLCWNQEQITTCSHLVVLKSRVESIKAPSDYILDSMARRGRGMEYMQRLQGFQERNFASQADYEAWSMKQAYIVASSMVNCAAFMRIDSCYLEGFERQKVEAFLQIDTKEERVALLLAFGYRIQEQKPKARQSLAQLLEYL